MTSVPKMMKAINYSIGKKTRGIGLFSHRSSGQNISICLSNELDRCHINLFCFGDKVTPVAGSLLFPSGQWGWAPCCRLCMMNGGERHLPLDCLCCKYVLRSSLYPESVAAGSGNTSVPAKRWTQTGLRGPRLQNWVMSHLDTQSCTYKYKQATYAWIYIKKQVNRGRTWRTSHGECLWETLMK